VKNHHHLIHRLAHHQVLRHPTLVREERFSLVVAIIGDTIESDEVIDEKDVPYKEIQTILQSVKPLANTGVIIDPKSGRPRFYPREWMRNVDGWLHRKRRGYTDGQKKLILYSCLMESDRGKSWWSTNISMPQVNQPDMSPWLVIQTYDQLRSTFLQTTLPSNCHVVIKHALEQCTQQEGESLTEYANYVESVVNDLSLLQQAPLDLDVVQYFLRGAADKGAIRRIGFLLHDYPTTLADPSN